MTKDHKRKLIQSMNSLLCSPLLRLNEKLVPLSGEIRMKEWGDKIGFGMNPCNMLTIPYKLRAKANFYNRLFERPDGSALNAS